jgi:antitoxin VapB
MLTRVFKSGNSLAIRIPKELAIADVADEVEIERIGNSLVVRPARRRSLSGIAEIFSLFSPDFMSGGREFHEELEREWDEPIQRPARG